MFCDVKIYSSVIIISTVLSLNVGVKCKTLSSEWVEECDVHVWRLVLNHITKCKKWNNASIAVIRYVVNHFFSRCQRCKPIVQMYLWFKLLLLNSETVNYYLVGNTSLSVMFHLILNILFKTYKNWTFWRQK